MSNDEPGNLPIGREPAKSPAETQPDSSRELVIAVTQEGLLVDGDPEAVKGYLDRIKDAAGHLVDTAGITKGAIGNVAGLAVGAASVFAQNGQFVQFSAKSMEAIRTGNLIPGDAGFFRMTTVDDAGKFLQQLQWREVSLGPTQMLSVQMIAVQMALKMAIAEVNESVKRVEGKVDLIRKLVDSNRIGDIRGQHATVERMTRNLDKTGVLATTDWESIASLGPDLNIAVERLRAYVSSTLDDFDASKPIQERAEILRSAVEDKSLGETLNLLIIAEESLNKWQRLRLARVNDVEPQHRERVVADTFDLLATQVAEDGQLYVRASEVLDSYRRTNPIDGLRYWSVRDVAKHSAQLKQDLDAFAQARRHQLAEWQEVNTPGVLDAASHILDRASEFTDRALTVAHAGATNVYNYFAKDDAEEEKDAVPRAEGDGGGRHRLGDA